MALVDPSGYSRPYDHELARALAGRGHEVTLWTSAFMHGAAPAQAGYAVREHFYRRSNRLDVSARLRPVAKAAEHLDDLRRLGARLRRERPDVVHVQWCVLRPVERRFYRRLHASGTRSFSQRTIPCRTSAAPPAGVGASRRGPSPG